MEKPGVVSGERILCGALLLLLPVTALVTLVAPLCFLPRDPTTTSGAIVPHLTQPQIFRLLTIHTQLSLNTHHIDGPEVDEQCAWQENPLPLDEGLGGLCAAAPSTLICLRLPPTWVRFKAAPDAAGELPPRKSSRHQGSCQQGKAARQQGSCQQRK